MKSKKTKGIPCSNMKEFDTIMSTDTLCDGCHKPKPELNGGMFTTSKQYCDECLKPQKCDCDARNDNQIGHFGDCALIVKPQHTPTPWRVEESSTDQIDDGRNFWLEAGTSEDSEPIFHMGPRPSRTIQENRANAAFIVRAVNSHEELLSGIAYVSGLSEFQEGGKYAGAGVAFRKAIAKAEGK